MAATPELSSKQPVPIDEMQAIIANTEKKCVLQLLPQPGEELNIDGLNSRFAQAQDPVGAVTYKASNNLPRNIIGSHSMAGTFAASPDFSKANWWAEKAADSTIPDSLAGHNLGLTADYGLSLEEFWGKTSKAVAHSLRSPQLRLKIFEALSDAKPGQPISIPNLASSLGIKRSIVHTHIQQLYRFGFIEYNATEPRSQTVTFEIVGDPDPTQSTLTQKGRRLRNYPNYAGGPSARTRLGQKLMEFQQAGKTTFSYDDIGGEGGGDSGSTLSLGNVRMKLMVGVMVREGVLKRHHKPTNAGNQFSDISLDEQQKEIIDRTVRFHRGLRDNDPAIIQEGLDRANAIMDDKKLVAELLQRGYDHSPHTRKQSFEQRAASIGSLLVGDAVELSTQDIQQQLEAGALTLNAVSRILRKMRAGGTVAGRKVGNTQYWRLNT